MSVEFNINSVLNSDYTVYTITVATIIYVYFRMDFKPMTVFIDSIIGKLILFALIIWLLSEEHWTISICFVIILMTTVFWLREKRDYEIVKLSINTDEQVKKSGNKCSRENIHRTQAEKEVPGPNNQSEFYNI